MAISALIDSAELPISGVQRVIFLRFVNSFKPPFRLDASLEKISERCGVTKPQLSELFKMLIGEGFMVSERNVNSRRGGRIYSSNEALDHFLAKFVDTGRRSFELKAKELLGLAPDTGFLTSASAQGGWGKDLRARLLAATLINRSDESGVVEKLTWQELLKITGMTRAGITKVLERLIDAKLALYIERNRSELDVLGAAERLSDATKARLKALKAVSNECQLGRIPNQDILKPRGFQGGNTTVYLNTDVLHPLGSLGRDVVFSSIASEELSGLILGMTSLRTKLLKGCSKAFRSTESKLASFNCTLSWPAIDLLASIDQEFDVFKLELLKTVRWRTFRFLCSLQREHNDDYRQLLLEDPKFVVAKLRCGIQSNLFGDRKEILNGLLDYLALKELQNLIGEVKYGMSPAPAGHYLAYIQFLSGEENTDGIKARVVFLQDAVMPRET